MQAPGINVAAAKVNSMFNPRDNMDVGEMVLCLLEIGKLRNKEFADFQFNVTAARGAVLQATVKEVQIIAHIAWCLHTALMGKAMSVSEHLTNLSKLGHMLFVVFRHSGTKFLASVAIDRYPLLVAGMMRC